jgi:hypothetical protein
MGNQNQGGNKERLGDVDANAPTQPQDTRGPRSRRNGLARHLGPHNQRTRPSSAPELPVVPGAPTGLAAPATTWVQEVADAVAEVATATWTDPPEPDPPGPLDAPGAPEPPVQSAVPDSDERRPAPGSSSAGSARDDFAASFIWSSAARDGTARPWRSLFR